MNSPVKKSSDKKPDSPMKDMVWVSSLGLHLVLMSVAGGAIGYFLDRWLHTRPVFLIIMFFLGIAGGFLEIFIQMRKSNETK